MGLANAIPSIDVQAKSYGRTTAFNISDGGELRLGGGLVQLNDCAEQALYRKAKATLVGVGGYAGVPASSS